MLNWFPSLLFSSLLLAIHIGKHKERDDLCRSIFFFPNYKRTITTSTQNITLKLAFSRNTQIELDPLRTLLPLRTDRMKHFPTPSSSWPGPNEAMIDCYTSIGVHHRFSSTIGMLDRRPQ